MPKGKKVIRKRDLMPEVPDPMREAQRRLGLWAIQRTFPTMWGAVYTNLMLDEPPGAERTYAYWMKIVGTCGELRWRQPGWLTTHKPPGQVTISGWLRT